ncbi:ribonuclease H-like domain-containing protein [Tanacetum coccineum]|uniref:Ribonuclease H-like domain-containing protein n=1 Tax=Tanacetum coccineum TaxID=301880 RepID=A0ABQ4XEL9_9ASTR
MSQPANDEFSQHLSDDEASNHEDASDTGAAPKQQQFCTLSIPVSVFVQVNAAHTKTTVNAARPMSYLSKKAHSTVKRPIHKNTAFKNSNFNQRVNTVKDKNVNTARPKAVVNAARPKVVVNVVKGNNVNGNPQMDLQDQGVIDSGCSRHMTGNMSYLTDYEEIDGGYVAFGGNPKGGKITGKGTIKTGNLDFENVYFVRELKFNLFSVSQMCDKKNSVLFNDTECIILSPNFKLIDESQVLLRVPRKNNMYSVDLKNIVPKRGLTCLFAKATSNESKLWHRRLGHLNFKTMILPNFLKMIKPVLLVKRESNTEPLIIYKQTHSMATNEETNAAGTDTRPPMLVESDYDSWKIRIHRYIRGKPNGKLIWKSIQNGPTPHPMITDPPPTDSAAVPAPREKLDSEFSEEENKLEMADTYKLKSF